jgi:alpha-L-rhamnosidase
VHEKRAASFRKTININKTITKARAYIAAGGLFELYVNGVKTGNQRLNPMFTRYDRRILYITYDITNQLSSGENTFGIMLGNGWFNHQPPAVWFFDEAPWRARPKFCMDVKLSYSDGTEETVGTNSSWKYAYNEITQNNIYTGEMHDARLAQPGWMTNNFIDTAWHNVVYTSAPSKNIVSQSLQPIRDVDTVNVAGLKQMNDSTWVFNMGRNISGVAELKVSGPTGARIKLVYGERLDSLGFVDQSNIIVHYRPKPDSDPFQTDVFILSGKGEETFRALFNYKGFQYVQVVCDKSVQLDKSILKAYFMHSDVPQRGYISSSSELLNKIWRATNNSYLSNLFGYPTDCPQREKNGWTGDAHIAVETGLYNYDGITVYEKWLADLRDAQEPNGVLPAIVPTAIWGYDWANGPDWTSSVAIIPWNVYLFYGDTLLLKQSYNAIRQYVDHITSISPDGLTDWGLGDWIPIKSEATKELATSIYYYVDADILTKAATLFGNKADASKYDDLRQKIKNAINAKYLNRETGLYANGYQTELSMPLFWGVVPDDMKTKVAANLAKRVKGDGQLDVGLLGSKAILNALAENGYADIAYDLASRDTYPSWGWWIKNGATTLYENWRIDNASDVSFNHIMFGEIGAWYYKALGGIYPDEMQPGFKHIILKPNFVNGLNQFEARHQSPYGWVISKWKKENGKVQYEVEIPSNSTATLYLTGSAPTLLNAGKHEFNIKQK